MKNFCSRNCLLYGSTYKEKLLNKKVAIFGLGGVGSWTAEMLARVGIERFVLVDFDTVAEININRQLIALHSTINQKKIDVLKKRLLDINPQITIEAFEEFYSANNTNCLLNTKPDIVVDAIDTMKSKIDLLVYCKKNDIVVFSSMGTGNRIDPTKLKVCDISVVNTNCSFFKNIKRQLKNNEITEGITVVTSDETPIKIKKELTVTQTKEGEFQKITVGSCPFVPSVAGILLANAVFQHLLKN